MFRSLTRTRSWIGCRYIVGGDNGANSRCRGTVTTSQTKSTTESFRFAPILRPSVNTIANARTKAEPTPTGAARFVRSYHHRACGYLAGLHSYQPMPGEEVYETTSETETEPQQAEFESFESAWDAIQSVPDELLNDFEDELWETQSKRFVYGTKQVSVIDAVENHGDASATTADNDQSKTKTVFRYLILNERPNLIQTAVEVPRVGAPYHHYCNVEEDAVPEKLVHRPPSPVSQTHLGGLAMALPFWYNANGIADEDSDNPSAPSPTTTPKDHSFSHPNCLLIGAGGCSLAHTLAANLFLESYNHHQNSVSYDRANRKNNDDPIKSIKRPELTAVEACPEILRASKLWFGAGDDKEGEKKMQSNHHTTTTEPPFFDLVCDTGESYLESLVASLRRAEKLLDENNSSSSSSRLPIDILIIDAEDGSAPPKSMRTLEFWNELVLPSLNPASGSVVGVNAIGTDSETSALVRTMREAFCGNAASGGGVMSGGTGSGYDYTVLVVAPPPEAKVTDRHKLIFALPSKKVGQSDAPDWGLAEDHLKGRVDAPKAWEQQIKAALRATLAEP